MTKCNLNCAESYVLICICPNSLTISYHHGLTAQTYQGHNQSATINERLLDTDYLRLFDMADESDILDMFKATRAGDDAAVVDNV